MRLLLIPHRLSYNILPVAFFLLISVPVDAIADADLSSTPTVTAKQTSVSSGIRPDHLWTIDYLDLLWNDTGSVMSAPTRWDQDDWLIAGFSAAGIGAASSLDETIKYQVRAHRTPGYSLAASGTVLRTNGNMSSPSVLFALEETLKTASPDSDGDFWLVSFSAGFSAHSCRLGVTRT
jgi:hypothetical protein